MRSFLYWLARILGDIKAIQKGRVGKRVKRRVLGRFLGKIFRKLLSCLCLKSSQGPLRWYFKSMAFGRQLDIQKLENRPPIGGS